MTARKGEWLQTFTGKQFWPLDPRPEEIDIRDVAHHLAMQCRFGGACLEHYCPTPEQRVLTADLRWVPAGDLTPGVELLAFDEHPTTPGSSGGLRRRYRRGHVGPINMIKRPIIRLELSDGSTTRAAAEHPWLVATKTSGNQKWMTARAIADSVRDGVARYMHKFMPPWEEVNTRDAGWLAGIYDGEGHLCAQNRGGTLLGVAQKEGLVLDRIFALLAQFGFQRGDDFRPASGVHAVQLRGGWQETARLLGSIRPLRLVDKFVNYLRAGVFDKQLQSPNGVDGLAVVKAYDEGTDWVVGMETSTHTYFCEGFGAHNSVAQHSVLVSHACDPVDAMWGLLHDAPEAYLQDMVRPLKRSPGFADTYLAAEVVMARAVCERFGLDPVQPASVTRADTAVLLAEKRDLMAPAPAVWHEAQVAQISVAPYPHRIRAMQPREAEAMFLDRFIQLGGFLL